MLIVSAKFIPKISINFFFITVFNVYGKATYQPHVSGSPNPYLMIENNLKEFSRPVKFVDAIFPVYKQKNSGIQKTPSLISTEDFMKWSNEKEIDMGVVDTCYPNFLQSSMDDFERHLYL